MANGALDFWIFGFLDKGYDMRIQAKYWFYGGWESPAIGIE